MRQPLIKPKILEWQRAAAASRTRRIAQLAIHTTPSAVLARLNQASRHAHPAALPAAWPPSFFAVEFFITCTSRPDISGHFQEVRAVDRRPCRRPLACRPARSPPPAPFPTPTTTPPRRARCSLRRTHRRRYLTFVLSCVRAPPPLAPTHTNHSDSNKQYRLALVFLLAGSAAAAV